MAPEDFEPLINLLGPKTVKRDSTFGAAVEVQE